MSTETQDPKICAAGATPSRCTGHCCEGFTLDYSPAELRRMVLARKRETRFRLDSGIYVWPTKDPDAEKIQKMVIYLGEAKVCPGTGLELTEGTRKLHLYTCSNYNKEQRICSAYEARPKMCSGFPYDRPCHYKGCTMKVATPAPQPETP